MKRSIVFAAAVLLLGGCSKKKEVSSETSVIQEVKRAEADQLPESFKELGLVNGDEQVKQLSEKYTGKEICWNLVVENRFKSGKPLFRNIKKVVNESTKMGIASFTFSKEELEQWESVAIGDSVQVKATCLMVQNIPYPVEENPQSKFAYLILQNISYSKL